MSLRAEINALKEIIREIQDWITIVEKQEFEKEALDVIKAGNFVQEKSNGEIKNLRQESEGIIGGSRDDPRYT